MKKHILPIVLAVPLALVACGSESTDTAPETALATEPVVASSAVMSEEAPTPDGPVEVALGETINLTQDANGARDIDLTINEISVSEECRNGRYPGAPDDVEEGGYYITMIGEMEVKQSKTNYSFSETWLSALDDEQYTVNVTPAFGCNDEHQGMDGYQTFNNPIDVGQRARGILEFWVSDMPSEIWYSQPYERDTWVWEVPELETSAPQSEAPVAQPQPETIQEQQADVQQQAPEEQAPVQQEPAATSTCATDFNLYQAGTTFYSDGTSGYTAECQQLMEQLMQDSGQFPDYPFGQF